MNKKEYYRPDEVAKMFSIARVTVYLHIQKGQLKAVRIGGSIRIPESALNDYIRFIKK